jgi:hypothetical protein
VAVPAGISNNRFPLGCGSDGLQRLGPFKPKLSDVIIRRRSEGTWPGASDLDLFYLSDGVHHRPVLFVAAIGQGDARQAQEAFPIGAGGGLDSRRSDGPGFENSRAGIVRVGVNIVSRTGRARD